MYLKNLTVLGFKSFAEKTTLEFKPGITAIVGPNGCGKSNVADAIRWVLGEQSAKALRGGEMADVIFNGTDKRKALGLAEVSLTIGDVDQEQLQAAGVELDYNEVTISRRVYRDGGSEYFINKTGCRLKDIQQLFMGTGVGRTSYSIMAQGHITQLLSSRPEDRRMVFEEAAGITKFKAQKREALRKLDNTEQNLQRVVDLIREVKRQIGSLQRQAGKARRYKKLMADLQHLETQLARHQFDVLVNEISDRQSTVDQLNEEIEADNQRVSQSETEIAQLRERLSELEEQISGQQQKAHELKGQIDWHDSRIHFNQERLQELDRRNDAAQTDINQGQERYQTARQEFTGVKERLNTAQSALEEQRRQLEQKQESVRQIEQQLQEKQEALRHAQSEAFQTAQDLTRVRNEINSLDLQKQGNAARLEKLSSEKVQLEEERSRMESRLQEYASSVEAEKQNAQSRRGTVEEQQQRLRGLQQELNQASSNLDQLLQQQTDKRSRLNVMEQLQADYEGFSAGTLAVLKNAPEILGSLVDKIRVPDRYITAIEAALGHHLQLVLTEQPETAQQILTDLNANQKGRASIAPLKLRDERHPRQSYEQSDYITEVYLADQEEPIVYVPSDSGPAPLKMEPGPLQQVASMSVPALSVIEGDESVQSLLESLLGRTRIVPDLETATRAWRQSNAAFDLVTEAGEVLNRHGVYTGGSANNSQSAPASVLGRKNQIESLRSELEALQQKVHEASRHKGSLQSEQSELQSSLQQSQNDLRNQEVEIATREGEFNALKNSLRLMQQKVETVDYEIQSLNDQETEGAEKRRDLGDQITRMEEQEQQTKQRVDQLTREIEDHRQQRDDAYNTLSETKVELASQEQQCQSLQQQHQSYEQRLQELDHLIEQRRQEIASLAERRTQYESEITESQQKGDALRHEREQVNERVAELFRQKESQEAETGSHEENLRQQRKRLNDAQQKKGRLEVELAQKNMTLQNLKDRIQQKYQINLDDIPSQCITITLADEGQPKVETLSPEEMDQRGLSTDWQAVEDQVKALQKRVDEIGPVNLVAIEEYEETEERHQFLTNQHDDLVKAKEQLLEVINRINTQTREMFTDTFYKIRENFRSLFTEIFGGGKADLTLVNEGDVLESGIEIMARPPGKQLRGISLLSGGEQTMTAVALLFAIYQVRPSPFCVLDELDAPLDESNINRFVRILQRFLQHSQFVIITHNKRTIGMADILYGVTMQEEGVSRIVSVKFHKTEEPAADHQAAPLVPPPSDSKTVEEEEDQPHPTQETLEFSNQQP